MLPKPDEDARPLAAEAHSLAVPYQEGAASVPGRPALEHRLSEAPGPELEDDGEAPLSPVAHSLAVPLENGAAPVREPSSFEQRAVESLESALKAQEAPSKSTPPEHSLLPELGRFAKYLITGKFHSPG